jgi:hypothetical protein
MRLAKDYWIESKGRYFSQLTPEERDALGLRSTPRTSGPGAKVSKKRQRAAAGIAAGVGKTHREIARTVGVSERTVQRVSAENHQMVEAIRDEILPAVAHEFAAGAREAAAELRARVPVMENADLINYAGMATRNAMLTSGGPTERKILGIAHFQTPKTPEEAIEVAEKIAVAVEERE